MISTDATYKATRWKSPQTSTIWHNVVSLANCELTEKGNIGRVLHTANSHPTYDNLNRLTTYTTIGGGVTTPSTVQVVYDARGNIVYKSDVGRYWYDTNRPNRLVQVTLEGYGGAQALSGTRAMSYAFDDYMSGAKQGEMGVPLGNGNLMYTVSQDSVSGRHTLRWETYTSFNMPKEVKYASLGSTIMSTAADRTLSFTYGPEHQRVKQVVKLETNAPTSLLGGTTWYLHGSNNSLLYEKEAKANGVTEHRHYLQAAGLTVALAVVRSGTGVSATHANLRMRPTQLTYYQQDHLGSIAVVTDANGAVLERMAYDPWGKRRFTTGLADKNDSIVGVNTDRGYTEHEHLDEMGVIHMNGRLYDPLVGRFMSADPFIQSPENLQSYNRFSYVMNNPLAYTDPSGYFSLRKFIKAVVVIGVVVWSGGAAASWMATSVLGYSSVAAAAGASLSSAMAVGAASGFAGSFMSTALSGGTLKESLQAGLVGGITGAAFAGINFGVTEYAKGLSTTTYDPKGNPYLTTGQRAFKVLSQSTVSGLSARLQGGSFADGFKGSFKMLAMAETAQAMRQSMIESSSRNAEMNLSGKSEGWLGDGFKIGGGRAEPLNVADFSPLGGQQGGVGMVFGEPYSVGSFNDRLVEAYAGPHDFLNSWTYDGMGNYAPPSGTSWLASIGNIANVFVASPFVYASVIQAYAPNLLNRRK